MSLGPHLVRQTLQGYKSRLEIANNFREMWALEYEVDELQHKFADSIGKMDLDNLDVDFIEDMMLKAKPLQTVLNDIRNRQIVGFQSLINHSLHLHDLLSNI